MADLRPRNMTQAEFAAMLQREGFPACSKTAVSLAERPAESGVQFTPQARKAAQGLLNSARRAENRANPNKTTVWLDDELREWVETEAYLSCISVGSYIRVILRNAKTMQAYAKAASDAATSEAAGAPETSGRQSAVPTGHLHDTTNEEENQG